LPCDYNTLSSRTEAITITQNNVYILGYDDSSPVYWRNGVEYSLDTSMAVTDIAVVVQ